MCFFESDFFDYNSSFSHCTAIFFIFILKNIYNTRFMNKAIRDTKYSRVFRTKEYSKTF